MNNAELIATIRNKIEGQFSVFLNLLNASQEYGYHKALEFVLSVLSDLESEKPMNQDGLEEEINRYLREECSDDDEPSIHEIAEHFAQWGAEHAKNSDEKPVPNDLEEAAWDCVLDSVDVNNPVLLPKYKELLTYLFIAGAKWQAEKDYNKYAHVPLKDIGDAWKELKKNKPNIEQYPAICFQKGADWNKEQMMEEAVECDVIVPIYEENDVWSAEIKIPGRYEPGEKVRVIIVKEKRHE